MSILPIVITIGRLRRSRPLAHDARQRAHRQLLLDRRKGGDFEGCRSWRWLCGRAGAVVTRAVAVGEVVVGVPARVVSRGRKDLLLSEN